MPWKLVSDNVLMSKIVCLRQHFKYLERKLNINPQTIFPSDKIVFLKKKKNYQNLEDLD